MHALIIIGIIATSVESKFLLYDSIVRSIRRYRVWQIESTLHRCKIRSSREGYVIHATPVFLDHRVGVIHRCNHPVHDLSFVKRSRSLP